MLNYIFHGLCLIFSSYLDWLFNVDSLNMLTTSGEFGIHAGCTFVCLYLLMFKLLNWV